MYSDDESTSSGSGSDPTEDDIDVAAYPTLDASNYEITPELSGEDTSDTGSAESGPVSPVVMSARAYQLEMLEASLNGNTIVAVSSACTLPSCLADMRGHT
jgi:hypothetical protein